MQEHDEYFMSTLEPLITVLQRRVQIIEELMVDKKTYTQHMDTMYNYIKQGFEYEELRKCPVKFKFLKEDKKVHTLELRHYVTNLMVWEAFMRVGVISDMNASLLFDCKKITANYIKDYIDRNVIIPYRKEISNKKMNKICHDIIYNLSRISNDFNIILGMTINIETFIDLADRNPRFNEIIRTKLDENMQPQEVERTLTSLMKEQIKIITEDKEHNCLKPLLLSGTGIKHQQLSEFAINGGLKPDLSGNTIPMPINSNFIVGGLNSITNYYIDSLAGRKASVMTKMVMGTSGHFAKLVMLLCSGIKMRIDDKECRSLHPLTYEIKSKEHLSRLNNRYYKIEPYEDYKLLKGDEKHLIGKKILVRGVPTCSSTKGICKKCYGELHYTNKDITIGAFAGAKITEPVSQNVLSSKHLLTTVSDPIKFNPEFYDFFNLNANEIMQNSHNEDINLNDYSLLILHENIITINEFDDSDFNKFVHIFHVKNNKTGEITEILEATNKELFLSPELINMIKSLKKQAKEDAVEIEFSSIDDDMSLFILEIENNELTRPLYNIMSLLNNSSHFECTTIDNMCQKMLDLLIESKINVDAVHAELLIYPLIRSLSNILERPNFSSYDASENYQLLTVSAALEKHPSVLIGLAFQYLGRQIVNPLTYKKSGTSFVDPFFKVRP